MYIARADATPAYLQFFYDPPFTLFPILSMHIFYHTPCFTLAWTLPRRIETLRRFGRKARPRTRTV